MYYWPVRPILRIEKDVDYIYLWLEIGARIIVSISVFVKLGYKYLKIYCKTHVHL